MTLECNAGTSVKRTKEYPEASRDVIFLSGVAGPPEGPSGQHSIVRCETSREGLKRSHKESIRGTR